MSDYVALLGTKGGPAIRPGSTMPTSSLLCLGGERIVVDCGLGVSRGLIDQGMALTDLKTIFVTHLHSDHYLELGPLLHTAWTAGLKTPVDVWGPAGLAQYWKHFLGSMQADIDLRIADEGRVDLQGLVRIHQLDAGDVPALEGWDIKAIRTIHPPLKDCFGLSFQHSARRVVFSGDTAPFAGMGDFAKGADLLVHEAMLEPALDALVARVGTQDDRLMQHLKRSHSPAAEVGRIAATAGVGALALHHLLPSDDQNYGVEDWLKDVRTYWSGICHIGHDGLRIDL